MVEDLKWVLEQDDLLPNLPLNECKYHPKYNALMVLVGQRIGGENVVSMLANMEARKQDGRLLEDDEKISKGCMSKGESYRTSKKAKDKCDSEILDLLDNPTPKKYDKLEPEVVENLMVANKIRDLLYKWEGIDEDSYEILPDAKIICCLNIVLNGDCLTVHPVP
ncbi:hypothetical protein EV426DRAFT_710234 [Tirmania nivea]|nr:hypothetical protein EV426DRAFT_710234 [Tirmania nivea]